MKKKLIILSLFCILLTSCTGYRSGSGYVGSLISQHQYGKVIRALDKDVAGLGVPVSYLDMADLYQRTTIYQYHLKDYESAIKDYSKMIELSDGVYNAYYGRSRCYGELGDTLSVAKD